MDTTFALQALGLRYVSENYESLGKNVVNVPYDIDQQVASYKLESLNIAIDSLSAEQEKYLDSWKF
jgi:adenosylhomocysteinase